MHIDYQAKIYGMPNPAELTKPYVTLYLKSSNVNVLAEGNILSF